MILIASLSTLRQEMKKFQQLGFNVTNINIPARIQQYIYWKIQRTHSVFRNGGPASIRITKRGERKPYPKLVVKKNIINVSNVSQQSFQW
jgi:hypothetical protein